MKKRLMMAFAAAALVAAMVPGVASAAPPAVSNTGVCVGDEQATTVDRAAFYVGFGGGVYGPAVENKNGSQGARNWDRGGRPDGFDLFLICPVPNQR